MNYTLRDPNGNVLLAVESSPVVTEADMRADLDKAAKACESAFDEVTKYQDAMAVMSTEGFGEQAKAVASKVWEKIKQFCTKIKEICKFMFGKIKEFIVFITKHIKPINKIKKPDVDKMITILESKSNESVTSWEGITREEFNLARSVENMTVTKHLFDHFGDIYKLVDNIKNEIVSIKDKTVDPTDLAKRVISVENTSADITKKIDTTLNSVTNEQNTGRNINSRSELVYALRLAKQANDEFNNGSFVSNLDGLINRIQDIIDENDHFAQILSEIASEARTSDLKDANAKCKALNASNRALHKLIQYLNSLTRCGGWYADFANASDAYLKANLE